MLDELSAIKELHTQQRRWRKTCFISLISIVILSSAVFIMFGPALHNLLLQLMMVISMFSIAGLIFLDWMSFQVNKRKFPKEIIHGYVLEHSKPEDIHQSAELILNLVQERRKENPNMKNT